MSVPRLSQRVAIVTGGATGIGAATARRLAEEGARVLVADLDASGAADNVDQIRAAGGTAESLHADVGTEDGVRQMVDEAIRYWGRLDIVVNNAYGVAGMQRTESALVSEANWDRGM